MKKVKINILNKIKLVSGVLKSKIVLSNKKLRNARDEFSKKWAENK